MDGWAQDWVVVVNEPVSWMKMNFCASAGAICQGADAMHFIDWVGMLSVRTGVPAALLAVFTEPA